MFSQIKNIIQKGSVVLMYHRIGTPGHDPWQLCVSPENFEEHLEVLSKYQSVGPLKEIVHKRDKKAITFSPSIAITFDDGYADNYLTARPILEKYGFPATFFVAHCNIDMVKEYWWDELDRILFNEPELPGSFVLDFNGEEVEFETKAFKAPELIRYYFEQDEVNIPNIDLYINIWKRLLPLPMLKQQQILQKLRQIARVANEARKNYCCMNSAQLTSLSKSPLVEIGVHTVTHPALSFHSEEFQEAEIHKNKKWLEQITARRMRFCAFPYGNYNEVTKEVINKENFDAGFTTRPEKVKSNSDRLALGRFQVKDWDGDEFQQRLQSWFKSNH